MRLFLVRHGETKENRDGIIQGQTYGELSKLGRLQAIKIALRLKEEKFDHVYVSDLRRAVDTAQEILRFHNGVPVSFHKELREQNLGLLEGKPINSLMEEIKRQEVDFLSFIPPDGESVREMNRRVCGFYRSILEKHKDHKILVVTHGGVIILMLLHIFGWDISRYSELVPQNTALSVIDIHSGEGRHHVILLNSVDHLL